MTQTDVPMKPSDALELIRSKKGASFRVPKDGYDFLRGVALAFGAEHLNGPEPKLGDDATDEEKDAHKAYLRELNGYVAVLDQLVEDGALVAQDVLVPAGKVGVGREDTFKRFVVYSLRDQPAVSLSTSPINLSQPEGPVNTAADLLELIREEGTYVYYSWFGSEGQLYGSTVGQLCGDDKRDDIPRRDELLGFVQVLREAGEITVRTEPCLVPIRGTKGKVHKDVPVTLYFLRAA